MFRYYRIDRPLSDGQIFRRYLAIEHDFTLTIPVEAGDSMVPVTETEYTQAMTALPSAFWDAIAALEVGNADRVLLERACYQRPDRVVAAFLTALEKLKELTDDAVSGKVAVGARGRTSADAQVRLGLSHDDPREGSGR